MWRKQPVRPTRVDQPRYSGRWGRLTEQFSLELRSPPGYDDIACGRWRKEAPNPLRRTEQSFFNIF
jgi:hypothetical protein